MSRKYNIIINIAFWLLVVAVTSVLSIRFFFPETKLISYIFKTEEKVVVEHELEPVVVTEYKEIKNEIEWYHFVATAYSKNDPSQGTNDTTATGSDVREGIIAVDPDVIPFGTLVEIKDMGYFTAEDCGGKIKGNRIDIYFNSKEDAEDFGRRDIWIRFIGKNPYEIALNK